MKLTRKATFLAAALAMPATFTSAQTQPPAADAQEHDAHHPAGQDTGATAPATGTASATSTAPAATLVNPQAQMGMMMGDMRQMMGMMQQMMRMMDGGSTQGAAPGGMIGGGMMGGGMMGGGMGQAGTPGAGPGGMMGGGMPMMGMMSGQQGPGGPGMGPGPMAGGPGGPGGPGMFRHTEGILAFYKAELRITDAQTAPWNAFAEAVRTHIKSLREAMQRAASQRTAATAPEQLDQRVALLTAQLDASKAIATAGKALYVALTPDQRKLADGFMADHLRGMRGMVP